MDKRPLPASPEGEEQSIGARQMVNPRMVKSYHQRFSDRARGKKFYRAGFELRGVARFSRRSFRTASEAEDYGARVLLRWFRLYGAALAGLVEEAV